MGSGWFTVRAARRVGRVYAVEINRDLKYISARAELRASNVRTVLGKEDDPFPQQSVDAANLEDLSRNCPASPPVKAPSAVDARARLGH